MVKVKMTKEITDRKARKLLRKILGWNTEKMIGRYYIFLKYHRSGDFWWFSYQKIKNEKYTLYKFELSYFYLMIRKFKNKIIN